MFRLASQVSSRLAKNSTRPAYGSRLLSSIAAGTDIDCKESMFFGDGGTSRTMMPIDFHYEDVLRQDMLLKLNYTNVMEVPGLSDIRVVPKTASDLLTKNGKLAMEISCGQKFKETQKGPVVSNSYAGSFKDKRIVNDVAVQSTLRGHEMSNFLVRILTAMSLADSPVQIRDASVQFSMETEFCESSPELEDHFEIFEPIRGFNVTIATSAKTQDETSLLWSGFLQKDEGETQ